MNITRAAVAKKYFYKRKCEIASAAFNGSWIHKYITYPFLESYFKTNEEKLNNSDAALQF